MALGLSLVDPQVTGQIVGEIQRESEIGRRAEMLKRHDIYRDGGMRFLLEQIKREFSQEAINEMRLVPLNLLKKIINKRSIVYKQAPIRRAQEESDQELVDFYVKHLALDEKMMKANRYFNLFSNTALYLIPGEDGAMQLHIVPPYLYSIVPDRVNQTEVDTWVFNAFIEVKQIFQGQQFPFPATGKEGFSREKQLEPENDLIASGDFRPEDSRMFIMWNDAAHVTTDNQGSILKMDREMGPEQFVNPFGTAPVVNLAKDRDNTAWAMQGDDMVSGAMSIMSGWSDLLSIAKEQGFSLLNIISEERPERLNLGLNRAVWLRAQKDGVTPSMSYVTASSPLAEYKDLLMDLLALLLTTNDMPVNEVGGLNSSKTITSGFQGLIEMSSTLDAIETDKPMLRKAETELWEEKISVIHNTLHDMGALEPDIMSLGKFSEDFEISITYGDIKPIESETERLTHVEKQRSLGLMTKKQALKKLNPTMTDGDIEQLQAEIQEEVEAGLAAMRGSFGGELAEEPNDERGSTDAAQ